MGEFIRRIGHDIRHLRNIDAYAVAVVAFVFTIPDSAWSRSTPASGRAW
jgi:hypothetical protein